MENKEELLSIVKDVTNKPAYERVNALNNLKINELNYADICLLGKLAEKEENKKVKIALEVILKTAKETSSFTLKEGEKIVSEPSLSKEFNENTWAMLCHLSSLVGIIGIPFANIIAPLIIWQLKKDISSFVNDNGKESLNFQISLTLYSIGAILLMCTGIGMILLPILAVMYVVLVIIASVKANRGEMYNYPFSLRLIK